MRNNDFKDPTQSTASLKELKKDCLFKQMQETNQTLLKQTKHVLLLSLMSSKLISALATSLIADSHTSLQYPCLPAIKREILVIYQESTRLAVEETRINSVPSSGTCLTLQKSRKLIGYSYLSFKTILFYLSTESSYLNGFIGFKTQGASTGQPSIYDQLPEHFELQLPLVKHIISTVKTGIASYAIIRRWNKITRNLKILIWTKNDLNRALSSHPRCQQFK